MVRLLSLSMKSFKSFARLTTVEFSEHLTGIVGPNGSGKSNIMDAVFFVLGSSRVSLMRAKKGGELIFNSKTQKPPFAEVRLTIDNKDKAFGEEFGEHLIISHRVRQDGLGLYHVNGRRMKKFPVLNLLARSKIFPDSHSIVQQGEIAGIVKKNSEERRQIIDEIAGIKEYDEKKHKALLDMGAVEAKVSEINGILHERQRIMDRLAREREQALKHGKLQELKGIFEGSVTRRRIEEREEARRKLLGEKESEEKGRASIDSSLGEISSRVDAAKGELSGLEAEIGLQQSPENMEAVKESERLSSALQAKKDRAKAAAASIESSRKRRESIVSGEIPAIEAQKKELEGKLELLKSQLSEVEAALAAGEKGRLAFLDVFSRESAKQKEFEERKAALSSAADALRSRERDVSLELDRASAKAARLEEERESHEKSLAALRAAIASRREEAAKLERKHAQALSALGKKKVELAALASERAKLDAEMESTTSKVSLISARLSQAGTPSDLPADALAAAVGEGFLGRLSDLVKPISASAGSHPAAELLKRAVVVRDREAAAKLARYVLANGFERTTILVLDSAGKTALDPEIERYFSSKDKGILFAISGIFSGRKRAKTIEEALEAGDAVTEDGILVAAGGRLLEVGKTALRETLEAELAEAKKAAESVRARRDGAASGVLKLQEEANSIALEETQIGGRISLLSPTSVGAHEERVLEAKRAEAEKARDSELSGKGGLSAELAEVRKKLRSALDEETALSPPAAQQPLDFQKMRALEAEQASLRERKSALNLEMQAHALKIKNNLSVEAENLRKLARSLEREEEKLAAEVASLAAETAGMEAKVRAFNDRFRSQLKQFEELKRRKDALSAKIAKEEQARYEMLARRSAVEGKINMFAMQIEGQEGEISDLSAQISGQTRFVPGSVKKLQEKIAMFSDRMARLGAINQKALEDFGRAEEDFRLVEEKKDKLEEEKLSIARFMEEVEKRKKEVFLEHYLPIAENFSRIYSHLSGGTGSLSLEAPDAPFDGGLLVAASPKGKEVYRIELLSGGEQTVAALAFIFAIQEHTPAPFYIFDEVDAALDKENSEKLAQLLSNYSQTSQIIVITHNDTVMRSCDQYVGVYMKEGVSRVISQVTPEFLKKLNAPAAPAQQA